MWILIIILIGHGTYSQQSIEFNSEASCESGRNAIRLYSYINKRPNSEYVFIGCLKK
jgi:hypothetical protein